ncbi:saccharopine dehydrogenase family protein [Marilutibacter spongiae]|uniref:saccharopine dehydrogenase family protein n=1 Tax=Marilutibacter spongiae TaxID=2025720 RepID=UPI001C7241C8
MAGKAFGVVVLGGYGHFGRLIVERISGIGGCEAWVGGRDRDRATAMARQYGARVLHVDLCDPGLAERLRSTGASLVIHAAGPFQHLDLRVAEAALSAGMHYVDLADGRAHVLGIDALDARARALDRLVCSGASSVPALSGAVVDALRPRFARLQGVHVGITASAQAPGRATLASVLSWCGRPLPRSGPGVGVAHGLQGPVRHVFPAPLGTRWLLDCDVPDLALLPRRHPDLAAVRFSAGLGLDLYQLGGWLLSWPVRWGLLPDPVPLAGAMQAIAQRLAPLGDGCSGMFVSLSGSDHDGRPLSLCWELVAEREHGLYVPCAASIAIARALATGRLRARGAMPCVGLLGLDDVLDELAGLSVRAGLREDAGATTR